MTPEPTGAGLDVAREPPAGEMPASLPALLERHARERPRAVAVRQKRLGVWAEHTWSDYARRVARAGLGLRVLGVEPAGRVAILARNRIEWLVADLGAQGVGAASVAMHHANPPRVVADALERSAATVLVVEDEEQLDKVLEARAALSRLRTIVVMEPRGIRELGDRGGLALMSFAELETLGAPEGEWPGLLARLDPESPAAIVFPVGGTRGVVLTHANLVAAGRAATAALRLGPSDDVAVLFPLSEVSGRLVAEVGALPAGCVVHLGEGPETLAADLTELQPTVVVGTPLFWEQLVTATRQRLAGARWLKRVASRRLVGDDPTPRVGVLGAFLVTRRLRAALGLRRARVAISGGAPLDAGARDWLRAVGVPVREAYGLSETAGVGTLGEVDETRPGAVGRAVPTVELRVAPDGEILVRGPMASVASLVDGPVGGGPVGSGPEGGWVHTGDTGALADDGTLVLAGRIGDEVVTRAGVRVAPARIEELLRASPLVADARVMGEGRPYLVALVALVAPDPDAVARDGPSQRDVRAIVREVVDEVNDSLAPAVQIRRFSLVSAPTGRIAAEQHGELVEEMYAS